MPRAALTTDAALVGGDSGGPLFDMHGRVVGINSRIGQPLTANMHVPVNPYRDMGRLAKAEVFGGKLGGDDKGGPFLGLLTERKRRVLLVIAAVAPGSPAAKAGLKVDDIIRKFGDKDVPGAVRPRRTRPEPKSRRSGHPRSSSRRRTPAIARRTRQTLTRRLRFPRLATQGWNRKRRPQGSAMKRIATISAFCLPRPTSAPWRARPANRDRDDDEAVSRGGRQVRAKHDARVTVDHREAALGIVVSADGWILTKHSELKSGKITCKFANGKTLDAELVGFDVPHDLAMLKVDANDLTPVQWTDSKTSKVGHWVASTGFDAEVVGIGVISVPTRQVKGAQVHPTQRRRFQRLPRPGARSRFRRRQNPGSLQGHPRAEGRASRPKIKSSRSTAKPSCPPTISSACSPRTSPATT